jgi:hypothetical protein
MTQSRGYIDFMSCPSGRWLCVMYASVLDDRMRTPSSSPPPESIKQKRPSEGESSHAHQVSKCSTCFVWCQRLYGCGWR